MKSLLIVAALSAGLLGCVGDGEPTLLPNSDPALHKSSTELASDAAKRSYEVSAPKSDAANARAEYDIMQRKFDLVNLSDSDWSNVEVWVNQKYVVFLPTIQKNVDEQLNFEFFYDRDGDHFNTDKGKNPVQTLEVFHDGTMYNIPATME
ncbi:MAG: hypothetical protein ABSG31_02145 [Tepidisphaeraceae bacterium]|jgi:hypothetical protein